MIRFFDIIFSVVILSILFPLLFIIVIILRFTGEGEIFFLQKRVGFEKNFFYIIKFATMLKNSPEIGTGTVTQKNDYRILPFGRFLRISKLNEIPQLINILKGDMSLIGPRPQEKRCFEAFPLKYQKVIVKMKPGLSGIGSIVFRSEQDFLVSNVNYLYDDLISPYKGKLEFWYFENQSKYNYFKLILLTFFVLIWPNNNLVWYIFPNLPKPPNQLFDLLGYKVSG